jgi:NAD(P)-dependent dehydrogenase (short-subunit alcohol dehydrogenase family)
MTVTNWTAALLPDLTGRTFIVTGATSGLGKATADALTRAGAHVVLNVRNHAKGQAVAEAIAGDTEVRDLDLSSLSSVRGFASSWQGPIDVLINNAGIMQVPKARTADGFGLSFASRGAGSSVVRLPPTCHGDGDHGFLAALVGIARARGVSGFTGDGSQRWTAVHRLDAAHLFRLALEKAPAGSRLHAAADEGVPIRAIAEVIGRHLDAPVVSVPAGQASGHFGFLAGFLAADNPVSSTLTRELLGWQPEHPGLIEDLEKGHYFHRRPA